MADHADNSNSRGNHSTEAGRTWPGPGLQAIFDEAGVTALSREETRAYAARFPSGPPEDAGESRLVQRESWPTPEEIRAHRGEWIAISKDGVIVGHGTDLGRTIVETGDDEATYMQVPENPDSPWFF